MSRRNQIGVLIVITLTVLIHSVSIAYLSIANRAFRQRIEALENRKNGVWLDFQGGPDPCIIIDGRVINR